MSPRASFRHGVRLGLPYALAGMLLSLSFGVLARDAGFSAFATIAMSAVVFAGSAQFASVSILAGGGSMGAAVIAASLMNSRFLPMGLALGPSLAGSRFRRAIQGQTVVDGSWALANQGDGRFDRFLLYGATAPQYVTWLLGTAIGAFAGDTIGDPNQYGLDAIYPTFFLGLLVAELKDRRSRGVALAGGLISLALVPFTPVGVPVLAASAAALVGLGGLGTGAADE